MTDLDFQMDDLYDELDGAVMHPREVVEKLLDNADILREAWLDSKSLLFVAFGMNDGDEMATISCEWKEMGR